MSDSKILLTYKDDNGDYQVESVWATKEGEYYRINNIPFLASNIAMNDLIEAEEDDGALYFEKLIMPSGHSTIQMIFFVETNIASTGKKLESMGCSWEGSHLKNQISVDIPAKANYAIIKAYLDKGETTGIWSYKEACLAHKN
jgi:hypothetical protein